MNMLTAFPLRLSQFTDFATYKDDRYKCNQNYTFIDHPRSGVVYNFGRVCLLDDNYQSFDVGSSYLHIQYISR